MNNDPIALLVADLFEAAGVFRHAGEAIAAAEGQTQARWQLLSVVSDQPRTVPQAARRLGVTRQAVQRVANDLIGAALLKAEPNPDHRTSTLLSLTLPGRATLHRLSERALQLNQPLSQAVSLRDIAATRRTLQALINDIRHSDTADDNSPQAHSSKRRST